MKVSTNEFKVGLRIIIDKNPYTMTENIIVKPGKGQAFNRVKLRNLKNNRMVDRTFKSGESVEQADVLEISAQYLYADDDFYHFMNPVNYEQLSANKEIASEAMRWVKEEQLCDIILWNGDPIQVVAPNTVVLKITQTDPGIKGDSANAGTKPAVLETGTTIQVPLFIKEEEMVVVDTRKQEYLSRSKQ